jgi:hypothetical protein
LGVNQSWKHVQNAARNDERLWSYHPAGKMTEHTRFDL